MNSGARLRFEPDEQLARHQLIRRIRDVIRCHVPQGALVLMMVGSDDEDYLQPPVFRRPLRRIPTSDAGQFDPAAVIAELEAARAGAEAVYAVLPASPGSRQGSTDHAEVVRYLERESRRVIVEPDSCTIYRVAAGRTTEADPAHPEPHTSLWRPIRDVAPDDVAYRVDPDNYFQWAWHGLEAVERALAAAGKPASEVKRILDLPCGHGRVLRVLKARFPDAELTACDLLDDGVDFCAEFLGAIPVYSKVDPAAVVLPGGYDLIWCGSLLTHLPAERWRGFLELFSAHMPPGAVLAFTTHGRFYAEMIRRKAYRFPLPDLETFLRDYDETGFSYQRFAQGGEYGESMSAPWWVCREVEEEHPGLRLVMFAERGWGRFQDLVACMRVPDDDFDATAAEMLRNTTRTRIQ